MPYYPDKGSKAYYINPTSDKKLVADYARLSFFEVEELDIIEYWGLLHDAAIWNCNKSEDGRKYLENAWYYAQTKPDRKALREKYGKEGGNGKQ